MWNTNLSGTYDYKKIDIYFPQLLFSYTPVVWCIMMSGWAAVLNRTGAGVSFTWTVKGDG